MKSKRLIIFLSLWSPSSREFPKAAEAAGLKPLETITKSSWDIYSYGSGSGKAFCAQSGATILTTTEEIVPLLRQKAEMSTVCGAVFNWTLKQPSDCYELLGRGEKQHQGFGLRGVVIRNGPNSDLIDIDVEEEGARKACISALKTCIKDISFIRHRFLTLDFVCERATPITSIMMDWDGRLVVESATMLDKEALFTFGVGEIGHLLKAYELETRPFGEELFMDGAIHKSFADYYLQRNWFSLFKS